MSTTQNYVEEIKITSDSIFFSDNKTDHAAGVTKEAAMESYMDRMRGLRDEDFGWIDSSMLG